MDESHMKESEECLGFFGENFSIIVDIDIPFRFGDVILAINWIQWTTFANFGTLVLVKLFKFEFRGNFR